MGPVPHLSAIHENHPLQVGERNIQRVEELKPSNAAINSRVDQGEAGSHRCMSVMAAGRSRIVAAQQVVGSFIKAQNEIIVDGYLPARRAALQCKVEIESAAGVYRVLIVPLESSAAVVHVAEERFSGEECFRVNAAAIAAVRRQETRFEKQFPSVATVHGECRERRSSASPVPVFESAADFHSVV